MMDWTDRHCRYLHRLYTPHALLYTEMIVAAAIVRGHAQRLLEFDAREHPVALQLGGCDPVELAAAARIGAAAGYAEINLNVGCPSDRVKNGAFGACLMLRPEVVVECVQRMREITDVPVTVKCRIGIDLEESYEFFESFAQRMIGAGAAALIVHARNAILNGLSPKENREIPPLKYEYVHRLKSAYPGLCVILNGGLQGVAEVVAQASRAPALDGFMLGRAAYHQPALLGVLDQTLIDPAFQPPTVPEVIERMVAYARGQMAGGMRLHSISRHMHGIMAGREGARAWRRFLSELATRPESPPEALFAGLPIVKQGLAA